MSHSLEFLAQYNFTFTCQKQICFLHVLHFLKELIQTEEENNNKKHGPAAKEVGRVRTMRFLLSIYMYSLSLV